MLARCLEFKSPRKSAAPTVDKLLSPLEPCHIPGAATGLPLRKVPRKPVQTAFHEGTQLHLSPHTAVLVNDKADSKTSSKTSKSYSSSKAGMQDNTITDEDTKQLAFEPKKTRQDLRKGTMPAGERYGTPESFCETSYESESDCLSPFMTTPTGTPSSTQRTSELREMSMDPVELEPFEFRRPRHEMSISMSAGSGYSDLATRTLHSEVQRPSSSVYPVSSAGSAQASTRQLSQVTENPTQQPTTRFTPRVREPLVLEPGLALEQILEVQDEYEEQYRHTVQTCRKQSKLEQVLEQRRFQQMHNDQLARSDSSVRPLMQVQHIQARDSSRKCTQESCSPYNKSKQVAGSTTEWHEKMPTRDWHDYTEDAPQQMRCLTSSTLQALAVADELEAKQIQGRIATDNTTAAAAARVSSPGLSSAASAISDIAVDVVATPQELPDQVNSSPAVSVGSQYSAAIAFVQQIPLELCVEPDQSAIEVPSGGRARVGCLVTVSAPREPFAGHGYACTQLDRDYASATTRSLRERAKLCGVRIPRASLKGLRLQATLSYATCASPFSSHGDNDGGAIASNLWRSTAAYLTASHLVVCERASKHGGLKPLENLPLDLLLAARLLPRGPGGSLCVELEVLVETTLDPRQCSQPSRSRACGLDPVTPPTRVFWLSSSRADTTHEWAAALHDGALQFPLAPAENSSMRDKDLSPSHDDQLRTSMHGQPYDSPSVDMAMAPLSSNLSLGPAFDSGVKMRPLHLPLTLVICMPEGVPLRVLLPMLGRLGPLDRIAVLRYSSILTTAGQMHSAAWRGWHSFVANRNSSGYSTTSSRSSSGGHGSSGSHCSSGTTGEEIRASIERVNLHPVLDAAQQLLTADRRGALASVILVGSGPCELKRVPHELKLLEIPVHTVGVGAYQNADLLSRIAGISGGEYVSARRKRDLESVLVNLVEIERACTHRDVVLALCPRGGVLHSVRGHDAAPSPRVHKFDAELAEPPSRELLFIDDDGAAATVQLGRMRAGECRQLLVEIDLDALSRNGRVRVLDTVADAALIGCGERRVRASQSTSVAVTLSEQQQPKKTPQGLTERIVVPDSDCPRMAGDFDSPRLTSLSSSASSANSSASALAALSTTSLVSIGSRSASGSSGSAASAASASHRSHGRHLVLHITPYTSCAAVRRGLALVVAEILEDALLALDTCNSSAVTTLLASAVADLKAAHARFRRCGLAAQRFARNSARIFAYSPRGHTSTTSNACSYNFADLRAQTEWLPTGSGLPPTLLLCDALAQALSDLLHEVTDPSSCRQELRAALLGLIWTLRGARSFGRRTLIEAAFFDQQAINVV